MHQFLNKEKRTLIRDSIPGLRISQSQPQQLSVPRDMSRSLRFPNVPSMETELGWTFKKKKKKISEE
jgi:hypothetical protein